MTIESPCIGICRLDPAGRECVGCRRTLEEIARWSRMSHAERIDVQKTLEKRCKSKITEQKREP